MRRWQLREAKARLSEVVRFSHREGPQEISVPGASAVVVLARADDDRLRRQKPTLVDFLQGSPLVGVGLKLNRDRTPTRRA